MALWVNVARELRRVLCLGGRLSAPDTPTDWRHENMKLDKTTMAIFYLVLLGGVFVLCAAFVFG
jgi:hypothetical protein